MIVSLQRQLKTGSDQDREQQFFAHTLQYLTTCSGRQIEMEDWMITSYEVEFGHEIGSGGLYAFFYCCWQVCTRWTCTVSGRVFKGSWNKTNVAVKVLMIEDGVTPSSAVCEQYFPSIYSILTSGCKVHPQGDPGKLRHICSLHTWNLFLNAIRSGQKFAILTFSMSSQHDQRWSLPLTDGQ